MVRSDDRRKHAYGARWDLSLASSSVRRRPFASSGDVRPRRRFDAGVSRPVCGRSLWRLFVLTRAVVCVGGRHAINFERPYDPNALSQIQAAFNVPP